MKRFWVVSDLGWSGPQTFDDAWNEVPILRDYNGATICLVVQMPKGYELPRRNLKA